VIIDWHHRDITAGSEWEGAIDEHLNHAQVILLLISTDFIASDYCYGIEMTRALARHEAGEARVIPIILKPVDNWSRRVSHWFDQCDLKRFDRCGSSPPAGA